MPIIIPDRSSYASFAKRLENSGVNTLSEEQAIHADIRPARIGLLNLMPREAMERTETQWFRWIGQHLLQIYPVLIRFDDDWRMRPGASRADILQGYTPFSQIQKNGLDGLIITGANNEIIEGRGKSTRQLRPYSQINYDERLMAVMDWANKNVYSTIYSCWAAHRALQKFYGIERELRAEKLLGVYSHDIVSQTSPFVKNMDDTFNAPHSRWGDIPVGAIEAVGEIDLLAVSAQAGWILATRPNLARGNDVFSQGHPEYGRYDIHTEAKRDGLQLPASHYRVDQEPRLTWSNASHSLHSNWIGEIYRWRIGADKD